MRPDTTDALEHFLRGCRTICSDTGVYPQQMYVRTVDGEIEMHALAMDGNSVFNHVANRFRQGDVAELIYGLDRAALPGQGLEFNDFITVVWYHEGSFYTGVINYVPSDDPARQVWRDIDWDNEFWNHQLITKEVARLRQVLGMLLPVTPEA